MFSSKSVYQTIFLRHHDYDTTYDLVRIGSVIYDEINDEKLAEKTEGSDAMERFSMAKNAKLSVMAILLLPFKEKKRNFG